MDRLEALQLFVRVVEAGSLTKAARALGVVQPTVSKQISLLEEWLGRAPAQSYRARPERHGGRPGLLRIVRAPARGIRRGRRAHRTRSGSADRHDPGGVVAGIGRMYVLPKLPEFFARFPEVAVDFNVSERFISLIEDGIDVAVRIGHLSDSALVARRIGTMTVATVASPAYLERAGELRTPADLTRHDCIGFVHHGALTSWGFNGPAGPMTIEPKGQVRSNDAEHLRAAALSGLGISQSASWLYAPEIASGEVRQILTDYAPHDFPIHAVSAGACRAAYGCSSIF